MEKTFSVGDIVKYAQPQHGEAALTFTLLELRGDRVLLESRDFPADYRFTPTEVVAIEEIAHV